MNDSTTTVSDLKNLCDNFAKERDWQQFHTPRNLSMSIAVEAAELMELFLWIQDGQEHLPADKREAIENELADVVRAALLLANGAGIDVAAAIERKVKKDASKYPVEKCRGKSNKWTDYL